jgi:hypothetical protein
VEGALPCVDGALRDVEAVEPVAVVFDDQGETPALPANGPCGGSGPPGGCVRVASRLSYGTREWSCRHGVGAGITLLKSRAAQIRFRSMAVMAVKSSARPHQPLSSRTWMSDAIEVQVRWRLP